MWFDLLRIYFYLHLDSQRWKEVAVAAASLILNEYLMQIRFDDNTSMRQGIGLTAEYKALT